MPIKKKLTEKQIDQLLADYKHGATKKGLAEYYKIHIDTVSNYLDPERRKRVGESAHRYYLKNKEKISYQQKEYRKGRKR